MSFFAPFLWLSIAKRQLLIGSQSFVNIAVLLFTRILKVGDVIYYSYLFHTVFHQSLVRSCSWIRSLGLYKFRCSHRDGLRSHRYLFWGDKVRSWRRLYSIKSTTWIRRKANTATYDKNLFAVVSRSFKNCKQFRKRFNLPNIWREKNHLILIFRYINYTILPSVDRLSSLLCSLICA